MNAVPWLAAVVVGVGLALAAAFAPTQAAFAVLAVAAVCFLIGRFGWRLGLWILFVATVPVRKPLSVDLVGTVTLYFNDVLLVFLLLVTLWEKGVRDVIRASFSFRIGALLALMSVAGLYTATNVKWGVSIALHEIAQVVAFYVAWHQVRSAHVARVTLLAFVVGIAPAALLGLHQSSLPPMELHGADREVKVAWDEKGQPKVRVFSTFEHPLHFSHALSMAAGLGAGLMVGRGAVGVRIVPLVALAVYCNQFTYSVGGLLGTAGGLLAAVALSRRKRWLALVPVVLAAWALAAPATFLLRIENAFSPTNPTTAARLITYHQTWQVLRDHPIFGVGWGSIRTVLEHDYRVTRDTVVAFTAENYFLERALALGLVGMALTIALCVHFFRNARARPRDAWPRAALLAGGAAFYVQAQVIPAADPESRYILWTMFAIAERMRQASLEAGEGPPEDDGSPGDAS